LNNYSKDNIIIENKQSNENSYKILDNISRNTLIKYYLIKYLNNNNIIGGNLYDFIPALI
jgi:hypothetical protein